MPKRKQKLPAGYKSWQAMRDRCSRPAAHQYENYGGRGIEVCQRWMKSFRNFISDMGPPPSRAHSIDRIDSNGNYEPSNCRWATPLQQQRNRTNNLLITYDGKTMCLSEWAETIGISPELISYRIKRGWELSRALSPIKRKPIPLEVREQVAAAAASGEGKNSISRRLRVPISSVHRICGALK